MTDVYVVIQIKRNGLTGVDCVCKNEKDANIRVRELMYDGTTVYAACYKVRFVHGGD